MIYLFLAEGFEEVEALTPVDMLRRVGKTVVTVGVTGKTVVGSHGIKVEADKFIDEIKIGEDVEGIILPGGMPGTLNLKKSEKVQEFISFCTGKGLPTAAICAAPSVLGEAGVLNGKHAVCYDGFEDKLIGAAVETGDVCRDGNIVTACGAAAALNFSFALVEQYVGADALKKLKGQLLCHRSI